MFLLTKCMILRPAVLLQIVCLDADVFLRYCQLTQGVGGIFQYHYI